MYFQLGESNYQIKQKQIEKRQFEELVIVSDFSHEKQKKVSNYQNDKKTQETSHKQVIEDKIRQVFGKDADTAIRICKAESNFNPQAINKKTDCYGLFQIRAKYHQDKIQGRDILSPDVNIEVAYKIFKSNGWSAWMTY